MTRIGVVATIFVGVCWLLFTLAAWDSGDGLAIGVAIPIFTICALFVLALVWLVVLFVRAARDYFASPPS